jgi:LysM repeat protein
VITRREFLNTTGLGLAGLAVGGPTLLAKSAGASTHKVRAGDTLSGIATRHGITVTSLKIANHLKDDRIFVGQVLVIPGNTSVLKRVISVTSGLKIKRGRWRYVVAHHSGIEAGNAKAYGAAHLRRGMENGLAYDFVIGNGRDSGEGEIEIGPRWIRQIDGGHVRNDFYNAHGIGICLVGNFETRRPSAKQMDSFTALVDWLRDEAPLGAKPGFTVHRWVDPHHTVCPGRHFPYAEMKRRYA